MRVLLVDDEEELVSAMAERLDLRGIEADWTTTPEKALTLARENRYDIMILDVKLPGMSGFDLKKSLDQVSQNQKYIFLTGHGSDEDYLMCTADDNTACYMVKPVKIEELIAEMKSNLELE